MHRDQAFIDRVIGSATRIKDGFSLCEFMGKTEKEVMVAQTMRAALINLKEHGEPFSFKGKGVDVDGGGGLAENRSSYAYLIREGYFVEEERLARTVIFPTEKLLDKLEAFFAEPAPA